MSTPTTIANDVLAEYRAFLADRAKLERNPNVAVAYERAAERFSEVEVAVANLKFMAACALHDIEWSHTTWSGCCPICARHRDYGHRPGCKLAASLARVQGDIR